MTASLRSFSLRTKLIACFLVFGLTPLTVAATLAYTTSSKSLTSRASQSVATDASVLGELVDRNLFERYGDVQAFAANGAAKGDQQTVAELANFYTKTYGIYDLMLVADANGHILAANTVKPDGSTLETSALLGKSVKGEEWFEKAVRGEIQPATTYFTDLQPDPMATQVLGAPTASLNFTAPIRDTNGTVQRVWSNRASWDRIVGQVMTERLEKAKADGVHLNAQLLSKDGLVLWSDKPDEMLTLNIANKQKAAIEAITGKSGATTGEHYRGGRMITGYAHTDGALGFAGYGWSVLVSQPIDEALSDATGLRDFMIMLWLLSAVVLSGLSLLIARGIARPLRHSSDAVSDSAVALKATAEELGASAEQTAAQAGVLAATSEQVSQGVATVATAMEEMDASISEISQSASDATGVVTSAIRTVESTTTTVGQLGISSAEIGKVIDVITSIAEQTNLLALNATIEAARAGDAGKGFAVVANEVKELAKETATATEEISSRINAIQRDTDEAVSAIGEISAVMAQVQDIQTAIASAVEEQTATTAEIARTVNQVALGSEQIAQNITAVAAAARGTAGGARGSHDVADNMASVASELGQLVDGTARTSPVAMLPVRVPLPRRDLLDAPAPLDGIGWTEQTREASPS